MCVFFFEYPEKCCIDKLYYYYDYYYIWTYVHEYVSTAVSKYYMYALYVCVESKNTAFRGSHQYSIYTHTHTYVHYIFIYTLYIYIYTYSLFLLFLISFY